MVAIRPDRYCPGITVIFYRLMFCIEDTGER